MRQGYVQVEQSTTIPAILLSSWVIASAVFGPNFFVLRIAGLFDIFLERLLFVLILVVLLVGLFQGRLRFRENFIIELVMGGFVLICILSMIRTGFFPTAFKLPSPWFAFIMGYLFPFIVFIFVKNYITREKDVTTLFQTLFFFGIYLCIISFFEYANLRQYVFPRYINDPAISVLHLERARGPFLNSAFNGVAILIGFISGLHLLQNKTGFARFFHLTALFLFFPAVFFTQTRSVYLGLILTLVIFLAWYKTTVSKWRLVALPLAIVLILGVAYSPRLLSTERREGGVMQVQEIDIRFALLQRSYHLFTLNPLTGVGLAQFIPASVYTRSGKIPFAVEEAGTQFQHNHLLGIATELGIPGILIYLALVILILRRLRQLAGKLPETGIMGNNLRVVILAIWCVYLNNNLFVEPSNALFINAVPFLFAGLADGIYTRSLQADSLMNSRQSDPASRQLPMRLMTRHV
ncbi:MAG: hypothetical protein C0394_00600 [Syntrophus sp. (in: bacteria)]|nr:hypothetical protein [Syntrophus sp. (in: bacteria)]